MTNDDHRSRALVLGGGGAVGIGWQVGVLQGLVHEGIDLAASDTVLGTSAGALVGAFISTGGELTTALSSVQNLATSLDPAALHQGNKQFLQLVHSTDLTGDPRASLQSIGQAAQHADTIDPEDYLALFDSLGDTQWPAALRITAIDADTGELVVWNETSEVPLRTAVAASCALPMLFPPITVGARSYIDGGLASHLNATATAKAADTIVLSCHPLRPPAAPDAAALTASEARATDELEQLRQRTNLLAVEPDFTGIGATPGNMMDPEVARRAVTAGRSQARAVAAALLATAEGEC